MGFKDRLKRIDNFFDSMSVEEFDTMLEKTGIHEIEASSNSGMELKLNLSNILEKNKEGLYLSQTDTIMDIDEKFNSYDTNLVKAS